ncbi:hypothetical protein ACF090_40340 [Streptomyces sp. NPDC014892]|uniref:hypothetical protein n=1 Tax=Streptomyces sp. NPDC014892 TaxID=3364930 RepID=UPI0036F6FC69
MAFTVSLHVRSAFSWMNVCVPGLLPPRVKRAPAGQLCGMLPFVVIGIAAAPVVPVVTKSVKQYWKLIVRLFLAIVPTTRTLNMLLPTGWLPESDATCRSERRCRTGPWRVSTESGSAR